MRTVTKKPETITYNTLDWLYKTGKLDDYLHKIGEYKLFQAKQVVEKADNLMPNKQAILKYIEISISSL